MILNQFDLYNSHLSNKGLQYKVKEWNGTGKMIGVSFRCKIEETRITDQESSNKHDIT
jgi:hypothetical protein